MLDLPYTYSLNGNLELEVKDNRAAAAKELIGAGMAFMHGDRVSFNIQSTVPCLFFIFLSSLYLT